MLTVYLPVLDGERLWGIIVGNFLSIALFTFASIFLRGYAPLFSSLTAAYFRSRGMRIKSGAWGPLEETNENFVGRFSRMRAKAAWGA